MRKKKQLRLLIILLLLLALALVGYAAANHYTKEQEDSETEEAEDTIALYPSDFDVENLASISYENDGKTLSFQYEDETWYYEKDHNFPLDQSSLTGMDSELLDLSATRKLTDDLENAGEYGLSAPSNQIVLTDTSGNSFTIYVGDTNEGAGLTYIYTSDDQAVYTVDSEFASYFTNSLLTLMTMEDLPVPDGSETFRTISLKTREGSLSIKQLSGIDYSTDYLGLMGYNAKDTRSDSLKTYGVTGESLEEFSSALQEISPTACVAYNATKKQLKKYGLKDPAYILTLSYTQQEAEDEDEEETLEDSANETESDSESEESTTKYKTVSYKETIYIGIKEGESSDSAESYYITWDGTDHIYQTEASSWEGILDLDKTDLTCMTPMDFQEDELEQLEITYQGKTYSYVNSILSEEDDSDAETTSDTEETSLNSEDEDETFENIAGTMETIRAEAFYPDGENAPAASNDTVVIKVTLDRKKRNQITLALTPYDDNYYAFLVDGNPEYLVNKTDVAALINDLK